MQKLSGYSSELQPLTIFREIVHEHNVEEVWGDSTSVLKFFNLMAISPYRARSKAAVMSTTVSKGGLRIMGTFESGLMPLTCSP